MIIIVLYCTDGDTTLNTFLKDKTAVKLKNDKLVERADGWKDKALHGQYIKKENVLMELVEIWLAEKETE